jgi:sulfate adenylyltransferase subunit 2
MIARSKISTSSPKLPSHLRRLESESIEIIREVAAEFKKTVMLYSIGKDSGVDAASRPQGVLPG